MIDHLEKVSQRRVPECIITYLKTVASEEIFRSINSAANLFVCARLRRAAALHCLSPPRGRHPHRDRRGRPAGLLGAHPPSRQSRSAGGVEVTSNYDGDRPIVWTC